MRRWRMRGAGALRPAVVLGFIASLSMTTAGCFARPSPGSLAPTLTMESGPSGVIAVQNGLPVPTFAFQPRPRLDLDGTWKAESVPLDTDLSLTDRAVSLDAIEKDAAGRQEPGYDDGSWAVVGVPGTIDPAPSGVSGGAWYRRSFDVPADWGAFAVTLKFGAVNYLADVWLNGEHIGYHEGGATPFAFAVDGVLHVGASNLLAVRVDVPEWGSRNDFVPWGLADWWEYGGITQSVWLEATPRLLAARADVVPHLDGADVSVVIENRGEEPSTGDVSLAIMPAIVTAEGLLDPDPRSLIPVGATPVAAQDLGDVSLDAGGRTLVDASFAIADADPWSVGEPALYVLRVTVRSATGELDEIYEPFGLRRIAVDPDAPRLLLNGEPILFVGAATHPEQIEPTPGGRAGTGLPLTSSRDALAQLRRATDVSANLIRTGHTPAVPALLTLADRLGLAIWEEIPLYHYTPLTYGLAMGRGIPQQMLREMALRDMNHPSVLFYGLSNESTGTDRRAAALKDLDGIVKAIDPTRLTGQASYGFDPTDPTSDALDVAGFTFYHGVLYAGDPTAATRAALEAAHRRYPKKPLMILEFGRWADPPDGEAQQVDILRRTGGEIMAVRDDRPGGYVGAMVWWALDDYYTMRPGITLERFGMFRPDGSQRPVARAAAELFQSAPRVAPVPPPSARTTGGTGFAIAAGGATIRFVLLVAYAVGFALVTLAALLGVVLLTARRRGAGGRV